MRRFVLILLTLGALLVTACTKPASPAGATQPAGTTPPAATGGKFGGKYSGKVERGYEITFEVSGDGKRLTNVTAKVLESCTGVSTSRISQLQWDGPWAVNPDGTVVSEGTDPEYPDLQYRFTASFSADGTATGTVLQKGAGCTTYELKWSAKK